MGKQIRFYMNSKTEEKFFDFLLSEGMTVLLSENIKEINALPEPFSIKGWWNLYIYDKKIGNLIINTLDNGSEYIDDTRSDVVEFLRTIINNNDKSIIIGRLWMELRFYNEDSQLLLKSTEFDNMYKKMVKWIKKNCPRTEIIKYDYTYINYVSEGIKDFINNGYKIER